MSTLNVSNITDGTTTVGTSYVVNGSAKAWVFYDLSANEIDVSFNTSSVTDDGAGTYTQSVTSGFSGSGFNSRTYAGMCPALDRLVTFTGTATATSHQVSLYDISSGATDTNSSLTVHGDLA